MVRWTSPSNALWTKATRCANKSRQWRVPPKCGCHGSIQIRARIENLLVTSLPSPPHQRYHALAIATPVGQKRPVLPSSFPTRRRPACRSASPPMPAVQSRRRHRKIRSTRQQFSPPRRRRRDCSPTKCAPWPPPRPRCSWQRWKNFTFTLGRETCPHTVWLPHYSRNLSWIEGSAWPLSRKWPTTLSRAGRGCMSLHALSALRVP